MMNDFFLEPISLFLLLSCGQIIHKCDVENDLKYLQFTL